MHFPFKIHLEIPFKNLWKESNTTNKTKRSSSVTICGGEAWQAGISNCYLCQHAYQAASPLTLHWENLNRWVFFKNTNHLQQLLWRWKLLCPRNSKLFFVPGSKHVFNAGKLGTLMCGSLPGIAAIYTSTMTSTKLALKNQVLYISQQNKQCSSSFLVFPILFCI